MADIKKVIEELEEWMLLPWADIKSSLVKDSLELLKQYSGLTKALEQSNAVNEHLNTEIERLKEQMFQDGYIIYTKPYNDQGAMVKSVDSEIERLKKENRTLKLAIQSMPNWLNEKRPEVVRCKDCRFDSKCKDRPLKALNDPNWYCAGGVWKEGDVDE